MAAPTYFGSAAVPVDGASATNATTSITITPPASMLAGDLVIVFLQSRVTNSTFSYSGSHWFDQALGWWDSGTVYGATFWTTFTGTWGTNPVFTCNVGTCFSAVMHVFRSDSTNKVWALDKVTAGTPQGTPTTPFTVTRAGLTTAHADTVTIASWATDDDNTWGTLSGTGWIVTGTAQYRNTAGQDQSISFAHHLDATSGTVVPSVSKNQATLGGDPTTTTIGCWYAYTPHASLVAHTSNTTPNGDFWNVTTPAINTTGASLLVAHVGSTTGKVHTVSDNKGNTWTPLTASEQAQTRSQLFYCLATTVGTGHTFTAAAAAGPSYPAMTVQAWSGFSVYENQSGSSSPAVAGSLQPGSITPAGTGRLFLTGYTGNSLNAAAIDLGFYNIDQVTHPGSGYFTTSMSYKVKSDALAENPTWSQWTGSAYMSATMTVFAAPSGLILTDNLVAYWKLDEASGNRADSTGNGHTFVETTAGTYSVGARTGKIGTAVDILTPTNSGANHLVTPTAGLVGGNMDFSIAFWCYPDDVTAYQHNIFSKNTPTLGDYTIYTNSGNLKIYFDFAVGGGFFDWVATTITANAWHFVTLVYVASTKLVRVSLDGGTFFELIARDPPVVTAGDLAIGSWANYYNTDQFDGAVDEVGMWSRALSQTEVTQLYNSGAGLTYPFTGGAAVGQPTMRRWGGIQTMLGGQPVGRTW